MTAAINPTARGVADGVDSDCNGLELCYHDADGDGYGNADESTVSSQQLVARLYSSTIAEDCDDLNFDVNPVATEICDNIDNDCAVRLTTQTTASMHQPDKPIMPTLMGTAMVRIFTSMSCAASGLYTETTDCDDLSGHNVSAVGALFDGVDNDCDGVIDASTITGVCLKRHLMLALRYRVP